MTKKESNRILNDLFEAGEKYLIEEVYEIIHNKYEYNIDIISTDSELNCFHTKMRVDNDGETVIDDDWQPYRMAYQSDGLFISQAQNKFIFYLTAKRNV